MSNNKKSPTSAGNTDGANRQSSSQETSTNPHNMLFSQLLQPLGLQDNAHAENALDELMDALMESCELHVVGRFAINLKKYEDAAFNHLTINASQFYDMYQMEFATFHAQTCRRLFNFGVKIGVKNPKLNSAEIGAYFQDVRHRQAQKFHTKLEKYEAQLKETSTPEALNACQSHWHELGLMYESAEYELFVRAFTLGQQIGGAS